MMPGVFWDNDGMDTMLQVINGIGHSKKRPGSAPSRLSGSAAAGRSVCKTC
jgi:hypothetical protein